MAPEVPSTRSGRQAPRCEVDLLSLEQPTPRAASDRGGPELRAAEPDARERLSALAESLGTKAPEAHQDGVPRPILWVWRERLALGFAGEGPERALCIDWSTDRVGSHRAGDAARLLTHALGLDRGVRRILDATAGLGRDALRLAAAGAEVVMIERNAVLAELLADAHRRLSTLDPGTASRLVLCRGDALTLLRTRSFPGARNDPDAVYLDPMFPATGKTALPKRDLQLLRALLGEDDGQAAELLHVARGIATRRVVVKRPPHAPDLGSRPIARHSGSKVRYDVYAPLPRRGQASAT